MFTYKIQRSCTIFNRQDNGLFKKDIWIRKMLNAMKLLGGFCGAERHQKKYCLRGHWGGWAWGNQPTICCNRKIAQIRAEWAEL